MVGAVSDFEAAIEAMLKMKGSFDEFAEALTRFRFDVMVDLEQKLSEVFEQQLIYGPNRKSCTPEPGWQGFTGIAGMFDEWSVPGTIWHHLERPEKFTPAEFNKLWDSFSKERKVEYVISLIT